MPQTDLSSPYFFPRSRIPISQENTKPDEHLHVNYENRVDYGDLLHCEFSNMNPGDSVARKRRHAVYVPRPPVWHPRPAIREGRFPVFGNDEVPGPFSEIDINENTYLGPFGSRQVGLSSCDSARGTPDIASGQTQEAQADFEQDLLRDVAAAVTDTQQFPPGCLVHNDLYSPYPSESSSTRSLLPEPYRQEKAILCTRLQYYRDIRLGVGEKWAIQEGSVAMCIDPTFTLFHPKRQCLRDEFDLVPGDLYVVCRLYADLWALCIRMSFEMATEDEGTQFLKESTAIGFIPLCAVTLAVNYSSFLRRCATDESPRYTGNGLPVVPPSRSHSLNAGKQLFEGFGLDIDVPERIHAACRTLSVDGIDADFVPLDSNLAPLFSEFGGKRDRIRQMGKRILSQKPWQFKSWAFQMPVESNDNREQRSFSLRDISLGSRHSQVGYREPRSTPSAA